MMGGALQQKHWTATCLGLALFGVFLVMHPYRGIVGDSLIYVTEAWAPDAILRHDLLFANQSQTRLTLFGPVMRLLLAVMPLAQAAFLMALLGAAAFFLGLLFLAHAIARVMKANGAAPFLMAGSVIAFPLTYSASPSFVAGEWLAVPRPFAEGFVLMSLAALLDRRFLASFCALTAAFLFHPLMALAGGLVVFCWLALEDRRWWIVGGGGAVALGLGAILEAPLAADLFRTFDGEWSAILREHTSYLFLTQAPASFWTDTLLRCVAIFCAARICHGPIRRMFAAALVAALIGLAASVILSDLWTSLLVVRLQPWRVLFVVAVLAPLAIAAIALESRQSFQPARVLLALLACAWVTRDVAALSMAFSIGAAAFACRPALLSIVSPRIETALWTVAAITFAITQTIGTIALSRIFQQAPEGTFQGFYLWMLSPLALPAMAFAIHRLVRGARMPAPLSAAGLAIGATILALFFADDRIASDRLIEGRRAPADLIAALPKDEGAILWFGLGRDAWHLAGRPNWAAPVQASSIVFSRTLAMEWTERTRFLIGQGLEAPNLLRNQAPPAGWRRDLSPRAIASVCGRSDAPSAIVAPLQDGEPAPEGARHVAAPVSFHELRIGADVRFLTMTGYAVFRCARTPAS